MSKTYVMTYNAIRQLEITPNEIDKISSGYELFVKHWHEVFFWMGEFRLEDKSPPLFDEQKSFPCEATKQIRTYRYFDRQGRPTHCRIQFIYDTANKWGMVKMNRESREVLMSNTNNVPEPSISQVAVRNI